MGCQVSKKGYKIKNIFCQKTIFFVKTVAFIAGNPFVYFFTNKNYREAFIQLLPTKLKNIMIKDPPVDQKNCGHL